jgi:hypothetical protein
LFSHSFCIFQENTSSIHIMLTASSLVASFLTFTSILASPALSPRCADALASESRPTLCVIPSRYAASNGTADDSPAIKSAFARCARDSVIVFQENTDYNVFSPISAKNLSNVAIAVQGNLHLPQNISYVQ